MTEKIGVMVVHGIGDPAPGEALQDLTDALNNWPREATEASLTFKPVEEKRLASQHPSEEKSWLPVFFPMFVRQCETRKGNPAVVGPELVFAEVFWGSASQLPAGSLGMVEGWGKLFFRTNQIVTFAAEGQSTQLGIAAKVRKGFYFVAQLTSHLFTGPIFALNVLLLLATMVYLFLVKFWGLPIADHLPLAMKLSGGLGLIIGVAIVAWYLKRPDTLAHHLIEPACWLLGLVLLWWLWHWVKPPTSIDPVVMSLIIVLVMAFLSAIACLMLTILGRAVHWLSSEVQQNPQQKEPNAHGPPLTISLFTLIVQAGLWFSVIPTLWTVLMRNFGDNLLNCLLSKSILADGLQWVVIGVVVLGMLLTLAARWRLTQWIKLTGHAEGPSAQGTHRLIVNPFLMMLLAVVVLVAIGFVWVGSVPIWWAQLRTVCTQERPQLALLVPSLAAIVIPLLIPSLRLSLDLVNDIINYIDQQKRDGFAPGKTTKSDRRKVVLRFLTRFFNRWVFPLSRKLIAKTGKTPKVMPTPHPQRPPVSAIRPRFRLVLEYLLLTEQVTHLVIIAHSQGSVIALDELACTDSEVLNCYQGKITLVTMGSPISHIYQHYFPGDYPSWDTKGTERWLPLFQRVQNWRHYYRIDDYVGMELEPFPQDLADFSFAQEGIGTGGHTEYWQDDRFMAKLYPTLQEMLFPLRTLR